MVERESGGRRKGEKYKAEFKVEVALYGWQHSVSEAALRFRVNRETVAHWISLHHPTTTKDVRSPEKTFVDWLREGRLSDRPFDKSCVLDKIKEVISNNYSEKQDKKSWFQIYANKLVAGDDATAPRKYIMYSKDFKTEIALLSKRYSKKFVSKIFNVDRKRILEWSTNEKGEKEVEENISRKRVRDSEVDHKVWTWYSAQPTTPTTNQVQEEAAALYRAAGHSVPVCSRGWYSRWRVRHGVPSSRAARSHLDAQLLVWWLTSLDDNKAPTHSLILDRVAALTHSKMSVSWVARLVRRQVCQVEAVLRHHTALPSPLHHSARSFIAALPTLPHHCLATFDEIPLNLLPPTGREALRSGFESCQGSLLLCYSATGRLFPSTLVIKDTTGGGVKQELSCEGEVVVVRQTEAGLPTQDTLHSWLSTVLLPCVGEEGMVVVCDSWSGHVTLSPPPSLCLQLIPPGCGSTLLPLNHRVTPFIQGEWESRCRGEWLPGDRLECPEDRVMASWLGTLHTTLSARKDLLVESFYLSGILVR